jgi:hypothetical protein
MGADDPEKATAMTRTDSKVEHDPALKNESCFHFPDFLFMLAWFASVGILFYIAIYFGVVEVQDQYDTYKDQANLDDQEIDDKISDAVVGCKNMVKVFGICMAFAVVLSFLWTFILIIFGEILIHFLFFTAMGLLSGLGALLTGIGGPAPRNPNARAQASSRASRSTTTRRTTSASACSCSRG